MYCLDTNIIIALFRGDASLKERIAITNEIRITPLVLAELFKGAYLSKRQVDALAQIEDFVHAFELLEFTEHAARIFGQRYHELQQLGKQTQEIDLLIASICIAHDATLVTRNAKDFEHIRGLKFEQW